MRVKIFERIVQCSPGGGGGGGLRDIEPEINSFLQDNPNIRVVDFRIASNGAPVGEVVTNYGLTVALLYEELPT